MRFTTKELNLITAKDILVLSTISANGWPHSVPVSYIRIDGEFYVPANQQSKKVRNLKHNRKVSVLIDDEESEGGVMVECKSKILGEEKAGEWKEYMRRVKRWQNDTTTLVIALHPLRKTSWFLKERQTGHPEKQKRSTSPL